ncbi:MAG: hypothetical protein AB2392_23545 [Neobacillus sp.]
MPTIEIVSLGRDKRIRVERDRFPFRIISKKKLISHRSLIRDYLKGQEGAILHLCNIGLGKGGFCFASDLIDWDFEPGLIYLPVFDNGEDGSDQSERFKFLPEYIDGLNRL